MNDRKTAPVFLSLLLIFSLLIANCGRQPSLESASEQVSVSAMSTEQAMAQLSNNSPTEMASKRKELRETLDALIATGQVKINTLNGRKAISNSPSTNSALDVLGKILSILESGQANDLLSLVRKLIESSNGNLSQLHIDITVVVQILNAALPVITVLAPQLIPTVQALISILPVIDLFIKLFQKPAASPSVTPSPAPGPSPTVSPLPKPSPKPTSVPTPVPTPVPSPTPIPTPLPSGQALYDSKCSACHSLGNYDTSGNPNLSRKGSSMAGKFTAGVPSHQGYSLSAAEITALSNFVNSH